MREVLKALAGSLWAAALSTFGDFVWARFIPRHRVVFGLAHGALLFLGIGLCLGAFRRRPWRGAAGGLLIGFGAAAGYYVLARFMGYAAMFVLWMAVWAGFALLLAYGLGEPRSGALEAAVRGVLAAVGSGLAFYAISGIWTTHRPEGPDYPYHFLCWTIAFVPAFAALLLRRP